MALKLESYKIKEDTLSKAIKHNGFRKLWDVCEEILNELEGVIEEATIDAIINGIIKEAELKTKRMNDDS